ncbi:hypothetical protein MMC28_010782 [Mycoblastus sanguinarius]|nr:hypothetical protein [Mycoblastus sanguinarius]
MLPFTTHLPIEPSIQDCLAWSLDGELAIFAGEEVYLLIPQRARQRASEPWVHVRLQVNAFTKDEWPTQGQASFKDMSIGEEQARASVIAISWSPPGLAKHRRSVLAVLTSNLILSLWASNSDTRVSESWERVLIVNKILPTSSEPNDNTKSEESRSKGRIRSMAWAMALTPRVECTALQARDWGYFVLAVSDDANGTHLLMITSPYLGRDPGWDATILGGFRRRLQPGSAPTGAYDRPSLFQIEMNVGQCIDLVGFSPYTYGSSGWEATLTYRSGVTSHKTLSFSLGPPLRLALKHAEQEASLKSSLATHNIFDPVNRSVVPCLIKQKLEEERKFSIRHNLGRDSSNILTKIWGDALLGDLFATCITVHQSKAVEYTGPAEASSMILINADTIGSHPAPRESCFRRLLDIDEKVIQKEILSTILDPTVMGYLILNDFSCKILYAAICASVSSSDSPSAEQAQAIQHCLTVLEKYSGNDLQAEKEMIAEASNPASHGNLINLAKELTQVTAQKMKSSLTIRTTLLNVCPFCEGESGQAFICFESLTVAFCPQKHTFSRCALTFLPILEPGLSKYCMDCGREFINDLVHPGMQDHIDGYLPQESAGDARLGYLHDPDPGPELLSNFLFHKFDTCPYCGGKFYD